MREKGKKCIAKRCDDCHFFREWRYTNEQTGEHRLQKMCSFDVMFDYIPKVAGSVDGLQSAVNESRNRSMETKESIHNVGNAMVKVLENIKKNIDGGSGCITITEN